VVVEGRLGEFRETDGEPTWQDWAARTEFFTAVGRLAPEVFLQLRADVFPLFVRARKAGAIAQDPLLWTDSGLDETVARVIGKRRGRSPARRRRNRERPVFLNFRVALLSWADSFHLRSRWVLAATLHALVRLQLTEERGRSRKRRTTDALQLTPGDGWTPLADPRFLRAGDVVPTPFSFEHEGWWSREQTVSAFRSDIRAAFETELAKYIQRETRQARSRGWVRTARSRGGGRTRHYEWLVRYQIQGWSHAQIAKEYTSTSKAVSLGLRSASAELRIRLRQPAKGGRPSGTSKRRSDPGASRSDARRKPVDD
jgi:hypothetical protein